MLIAYMFIILVRILSLPNLLHSTPLSTVHHSLLLALRERDIPRPVRTAFRLFVAFPGVLPLLDVAAQLRPGPIRAREAPDDSGGVDASVSGIDAPVPPRPSHDEEC